MNCPNCQSQLSCGCQKRKASDGKEVCTSCLTFYEASLGNTPKPLDATLSIPNPTDTTPTDIKITYTPPKQ